MNTDIKKYTIKGVLKTSSPLHITQAGVSARWNPDGKEGRGDIQYGSKIGFPLTLTRAANFFVELNPDQGVRREHLPVIPATTLRGMLRRGAARVIEDHVIHELNTKLSFEAYMGMRCGAVSGSPDGVAPTTSEIVTARSHVFYGIFGGGPRMLRGNLIAADAVPVIAAMINTGCIPDAYLDEAVQIKHGLELVSACPVIRKDDFYGSTAGSEEAEGIVEDFETRYAQQREADVKRAMDKINKKEKTDDDMAARGVKTMSFRQDVVVGVPFYFGFELHGNAAQVGLLLAALERSLPFGIGGRSALGYGRLSGTLTINDGHEDVDALYVSNGNVEIADGAEVYMEAMGEAVGALTLDDITRYMMPGINPTKNKGVNVAA